MKLLRLAPFLLAWALAPAFAADQLILASPHWEGVQYEFGRAFAEHYRKETGRAVDLHWRDLGGTSQIQRTLALAYKSGPSSGVDVLFGGGVDPFLDFKARGWLEPCPLPSDIAATIPPAVNGIPLLDPEGLWYGAALSSFGILENRKVAERLGLPPIAAWDDLCRPEFLGWVDSADPRKSGSVHMIYEIVLQAYGWDQGWSVLNRMGGNVRTFFDSSSQPTKEVAAGDAAEAVTIDLNALVEVAALGPENVRFILPRGLSILTPDGIAVFKGAPNADVARAFVAFVMSPAGQALWMKPVGTPGGPVKYPISRMGVWPPFYDAEARARFPLDPFSPDAAAAAFPYDPKRGGSRWRALNDLLGQTVIDVHAPMVRAWKAILALPEARRGPLLDEFEKPFVTEAGAAEAETWWRNDPLRAGRLRNAWMAAATERYDRLAKEAEKMQKGAR